MAVLKFTRNEVEIRSAEQLSQMLKEAGQYPFLVYVEAKIDPALAMLFLQRNECNRPVSEALVQSYARDIERGAWEFNGDSIRFDRQGKMVEGQHRCHAIARSGRSIRSLICFNSSWVNANAGVAESAASKLRGQKYRTTIAAIARLIEMDELDRDGFEKDFRLTPAEVLAYAKDAGEDLTEAAAAIAPLTHQGMARHAIYGWLYLRAAAAWPEGVVGKFFHMLVTGEEAHPLVARLRARLIADSSRTGRSTPLTVREKAYLIARTMAAWVTRENLERLQIPRDLEISTAILAEMIEAAGKKARRG